MLAKVLRSAAHMSQPISSHVTSVVEPVKDGTVKEKAFIAGGTSQTDGLQQIQLCENDEKRLRIEAIKNEIRSETVSYYAIFARILLPSKNISFFLLGSFSLSVLLCYRNKCFHLYNVICSKYLFFCSSKFCLYPSKLGLLIFQIAIRNFSIPRALASFS
ncbi:unnamed protein product [Strongylus vulgaris]|uniref:Uncharacterized protein n=1 Tax=Strongylus vulgaris TaxID=40348 RepID=A0A3P7L4A7_STRVU|nr:unnamed protein product [Strongylus vulgaris]